MVFFIGEQLKNKTKSSKHFMYFEKIVLKKIKNFDKLHVNIPYKIQRH